MALSPNCRVCFDRIKGVAPVSAVRDHELPPCPLLSGTRSLIREAVPGDRTVRRLLPLLLAALALAASSCAKTVSDPPSHMTIYSLDPAPAPHDAKETFGGHVVLGSVKVEDPALRAKIWKAVRDAVGQKNTPPAKDGPPAPRFGLSASHSQLYHKKFCFETGQVWESEGGPPSLSGASRPVAPELEALLAGVLKDAQVPAAPKPAK
jgi:hypothetical protein